MTTPTRPDWFAVGMDRPSRYREIRVPPEHVDAFLLGVLEIWLDPDHQAARSAFARYSSTLSSVYSSVARKDWTRESGWELVLALEAGVSVEVGLATFLPRPYERAFDPVTRRLIYAHILIAHGIAAIETDPASTGVTSPLLPAAEQDEELTARALLPALRADYFRLARPLVERLHQIHDCEPRTTRP